jgi:subtilisin family serine protease
MREPLTAEKSENCENASVRPAGVQQAHFKRLGVDAWQRDGFLGQHLKIAVLDSGFRGYRDHLGKDLPAEITSRSFRRDGNLEAKDSQHGILCGEVIHALAPSAELLFANWEAEEPQTFLDAVRWARAQGARLISCSCIMPSWSDGEGGGPVHAALAKLLGDGDHPGGALLFASAGNTAQRTWSGPFHAGTDGCHEWRPGVRDNRLLPWGKDAVSVELTAPPGADYDLCVHDVEANKNWHSAARDSDRLSTVVRFTPEAKHTYEAEVRLRQGKANAFHLIALGAGLDCASVKGSICFPADGPEVIAVGAVNANDQRMDYSSCGPNSAQPKPDFVAPVPFPSAWREKAFGGTSAAAPQATALAALAWCRHPEWTAAQLRTRLQKSAIDLGPPGHDCETGYGRIALPLVDRLVEQE